MNLLVLLIILVAAWILFKILQQKQGIDPSIYKCKSVYDDHAIVPEKPFFSSKYQLTGKMDKILVVDGKRTPMEIKSSRRPREPYLSHVMQLVSYCLLIEEHYNERPEFGILQYASGEPFIIPYSEENKNQLFKTVEEMRTCIKAKMKTGNLKSKQGII